MNVIQKKVSEASEFINCHKREIILGAVVAGSAVVFKNGYLLGCKNGAVKVLEALDKVNPEAYKALMEEAISKGTVVHF